MEKECWKEMQERIVKCFLDVLILAQLEKEVKSAYDIIAFIHKKFNILLNPGTIYSNVHSLERDGLIQSNWAKRKKVYTLTEKGRKTIHAFINADKKIQLFVANLLGNVKGRS